MLLRHLQALGLGLLLSSTAQAVNVLSLDEARLQMFPAATGWAEVPAAAVARAKGVIGRDSQVTLVAANFSVIKAMQGDVTLGYFVTDQVIGKFEKIDYAAGLDADGTVRSVRVLKYRESHGHEVAETKWLAQFEGRDATAPMKLGRDIDGITGATLSVVHLSEGVRRVTRLVAALKTAGN